ncbi:anti-sigma factor domain-containing protein [uncultured Phycicoccus sp.]|uniref:anti-sigma factor n=1 Tax=uncultured Phycicoccus sp. TaxID=661422 RepID=UPI002617928B|nr:anti-sigma factor [uncultured Phycicoccus sp.]
MNHPDDDTLAALALGETADGRTATHVAACPVCSAEVEALRSTLQLARSGAPELIAPPPSVHAAVLAALDDESGNGPADGVPEAGPAAGAAVGDELAHRRARRERRLPLGWIAGAAAAGLVFGAVGTRVLDQDPAPTPTTVLASASLDTLDTGARLGSAEAVRIGPELDLDVRTAGLDPGDGYLEVWLINRDLTRMVSIGVLRPGEGTQRFAVDESLIEEGYVIVDISREGFDDKPEHSGDSVVRGTLAL